jgi:hypothetical protein
LADSWQLSEEQKKELEEEDRKLELRQEEIRNQFQNYADVLK